MSVMCGENKRVLRFSERWHRPRGMILMWGGQTNVVRPVVLKAYSTMAISSSYRVYMLV